MSRRIFWASGTIFACVALFTGIANATGAPDWSAYLNGPAHSSYQPGETAITTANAATLTQVWKLKPDKATVAGQPAARLQSSPTVSGGVIYVGSGTGMFYAVNEATGAVIWKKQFPWVSKTTCDALGFVSTATVAPDPVTSQPTVYVAAADGYVYALNAADGSQVWRAIVGIPSTTQNDYYNWGSPTVANGKVYMGISSQCDAPLVQGGVKEFDQATGATLATYFSVPTGTIGGSVWSSEAVGPDGSVYATTGNEPRTGQIGDPYSIVKLDGTTLAKIGRYMVPKAFLPGTDDDFGGSPTLFTATVGGVVTPMVGACNKNGVYYALRQSDMSLVWNRTVSVAFPNDKGAGPGQCDAAATWDGNLLYLGTNSTTINGTKYRGAVRALDPATGASVWETGLQDQVIGSTTLNGSGVLAAPLMGSTSGSNGVVLLNAATGAILKTINPLSQYFGQPVWADGHLVLAGVKNSFGLSVWAPH